MQINIFYHCYLVNDWKKLIEEQFSIIYKSGLYHAINKLHIGIVGTETTINEFQTFLPIMIEKYTTNNKIEIRTTTENSFEYITMNWLKEYCDSNDTYALYMHTKGISATPGTIERSYKDDFRNCMMYFNVELWKDCIDKLNQGCDCCGIRLYNKIHLRSTCYDGNYWWTNSNYIKTITPVKNMINSRKNDHRKRYYYERWLHIIPENTTKPKEYSFYETNDYIGHLPFPKEKYRGKLFLKYYFELFNQCINGNSLYKSFLKKYFFSC